MTPDSPASRPLGASPRRARETTYFEEIDMRPTAFNVIVFALVWTLAVVGLIAVGYALVK